MSRVLSSTPTTFSTVALGKKVLNLGPASPDGAALTQRPLREEAGRTLLSHRSDGGVQDHDHENCNPFHLKD